MFIISNDISIIVSIFVIYNKKLSICFFQFFKIYFNLFLFIYSEDLSCEATANQLSSLASSLCQIALDNHSMFTFTGLKVSRILEDKEVLLERDNSEGFQLPWNKTWYTL